MFGAVLLSTAVAGSLEPYTEVREIDNTAAGGAAGTAAHGILLHLMLDEHAGITGIPKDVPGGEALRRDLRDFFAANGFRLFGNAISESAATRNSMEIGRASRRERVWQNVKNYAVADTLKQKKDTYTEIKI